MAVQPICEELQLDYLAGLIEEYMREDQRYSTEAFFPDELKDGTRWSIDVVTAGRGRGQVKNLNAPTSMIQPDAARTLHISPFHFGEGSPVTDEEMSTLRLVGTERKLDRARIVAKKVAKLTHRWRALRHYLCARCLGYGSAAINENGVVATIDYAIPTLANPRTSWANAASKIAEDIQAWISAFQDANNVAPRYVGFNPRKIKEYFIKNTSLQAYMGTFERATAERFFASLLDARGAISMPLFGLTWIPFPGQYEATELDATTLTDTWPEDGLTFWADPPAGSDLLSFMKARTAQTDGTGGPVADVVELQEPKAQQVIRVHANGIPAITMTKRIMRVADVAP